ncbi:uncharacterized protein LOC109725256 [Ananas comosus]|uniref:Uncharacterized protein LOC109725256 n=1 Tax=Ananas comosus TaxID=4615 RepID=A0A6P5GQ69_ANACO|nr:uncharacterized protein LOC109725256 [Ananas comosus]
MNNDNDSPFILLVNDDVSAFDNPIASPEIVASNNSSEPQSTSSEIPKFAKLMTSEFEMSMMGELSYFLGLQVKQSKEGIHLSQTKYAKKLVKKFDLDRVKNFGTPMGTSNKGLGLNVEEQSVDEKQYRSMIGSLLYLTASRPDIAFSVGICARYQANPKEVHLKAVKRIIRYV